MGIKRYSTIALCEDIHPGLQAQRTDREAGIVFGVKVLGRSSSNKHNVPNVTGTEYSDQALRQAQTLYEGKQVNANHPPRQQLHQERSVYDRLGRLQNVRLESDGLRGDLHLLKSHPLAPSILEASERMPEMFGLSHHATGRGEVRDGKYVVIEIPEVRSVDVVADAATARSLFESQTMKRTLREILQNTGLDAKCIQTILEMPEMPMADAPVEATDEDHATHLGRAITAIVSDEGLSIEEKKKKVLAILKLLDDGEEEPAEETPEEAPVEESRESLQALREQLRVLTEEKQQRDLEAWIRSQCAARNLEVDSELLESLSALAERSKITKHLDWLKKKRVPATGPRSQAARVLHEDAERPAKDVDDFISLVTR